MRIVNYTMSRLFVMYTYGSIGLIFLHPKMLKVKFHIILPAISNEPIPF